MSTAPPILPTTAQPASETTLAQAFEHMLTWFGARVRSGKRSAETLDMHRKHVRLLLERMTGEVPISAIDEQVILLLAELELGGRRRDLGGELVPVAPQTVAKRLSTLRLTLKLARRRGWINRVPEFPEDLLEHTYVPRTAHLRSTDELERLMAALPVHRAEWVAIAVYTGQHPADIHRMRAFIDADPYERVMTIRNTKNRRTPLRVPMPRELARILARRFERLNLRSGDRLIETWSDTARNKCLPELSLRLGLMRITATALRHTCGSWMVRNRGITRAAQEWLGHSSPKMLAMVYAHALPPQLVECADELDSMSTSPGRTSKDDGARAPGNRSTVEGPSASGGKPRKRAAKKSSARGDARLEREAEVSPNEASPTKEKAPGVAAPEASETQPTGDGDDPGKRGRVPRDGIEPPTRGFSVPGGRIGPRRATSTYRIVPPPEGKPNGDRQWHEHQEVSSRAARPKRAGGRNR